MIPTGREPEDEQTRSAFAHTRADFSQTSADRDQTGSDRDQKASGSDQTGSDSDQWASDQDQAASDRELAHGRVSRRSYDRSRNARDRSTQARLATADERYETARARDAIARERDLAALARDRAAAARDREADRLDAEVARLAAGYGSERAVSGEQVILRAARERERAAADRKRAAAHREQAAHDREQAAHDRLLAAHDRAHAAAERETYAVDELTGARRRGPGLVELQHEIDRVRRGTGALAVAYIDVDGLKATNDTKGHSAGDALLKHIVGVLQAHLRSYELIFRIGGDEFVCAISGATIENVRRRFDEINAELATAPERGSITVGFAQLAPDDSPIDLIDRADTDLLNARATRNGTDGQPLRTSPSDSQRIAERTITAARRCSAFSRANPKPPDTQPEDVYASYHPPFHLRF